MWEIVSLLCFLGLALSGIGFWMKSRRKTKRAAVRGNRSAEKRNDKMRKKKTENKMDNNFTGK